MEVKRCNVCGELLVLDKERIYLVENTNFFTKECCVYDAVDCVKCGCQNILKERKKERINRWTKRKLEKLSKH